MARAKRNSLVALAGSYTKYTTAFLNFKHTPVTRWQCLPSSGFSCKFRSKIQNKASTSLWSHHCDEDEIIPFIYNVEDESSILQTPSPAKSTWNPEDDWSLLSDSFFETYSFRGEYDEVITDADLLLAEQKDLLSSIPYDQDWEPSVNDDPSSHDDTYIKDSTDLFVENAIETIVNQLDYHEEVPLYDTVALGLESTREGITHDDEMVYMIRCNQSPEQLLLSQGKVLPELTRKEKYAAKLLFEMQIGASIQPKMTPFFESGVNNIFSQHSVQAHGGEAVMDRNGMAQWMTKCLNYESNSGGIRIGSFDNAISWLLSRYCRSNGSGQLTLEEFSTLYLECAWIGYLNDARTNKELMLKNGKYHPVPPIDSSVIVRDRKNTEQLLEDASLSIIWRDLEAHGIFSPVEVQRVQHMKEMEELQQSAAMKAASSNDIVFDECELLENYEDMLSEKSNGEYGIKRDEKSSHELVEMAYDGETPKRIRDGKFVFIDEESCIGCSQCATIAPDSFKMLEDSGRARTFYQRNTGEVEEAVLSCPVSCMHMVSYAELKEMETCRDEESFGGRMTHVPVHVAGRDSDANRKSSWYHYLKAKCGSTACPQRGCFDCPNYKPGENPYFKLRHKKAEHIRANDFKLSGDADQWRIVADI